MTTVAEKAKKKDIPTDEFEKAKRAAKDAYDNFLTAKQHLTAAARTAGVDLKDSANEQIEETMEFITDKEKEMLKSTEAYVKENPATSAGIAFLAGFLISKILSK